MRTPDRPQHVVVVGAGISGLTAARELALAGHRVTVLEASGVTGGKLSRDRLDALSVTGLSLDVGAESMLARRPEGLELIADLGLGSRRTTPTPAKPQALIGGEVRLLPPSAMGVPTDLDALRGYLSADGLDRARREPDLPAPPLDGDVGIGAYVAERFGDEVTDRLLEPLLGGVYAGRSRELSFAAVNAPLYLRAAAGGSLSGAAADLARAGQARTTAGPVFAGLAGGVTTLVEALTDDLTERGVDVRRSAPVRELVRSTAGGYRLTIGSTTDPVTLDADQVLLAVPAAPASRLLTDGRVSPDAARELAEIPYASVAVITLLVRGTDLTGSGLLVPPGELPTVKALTYAHRKWAWVAEAAEAYAGEPIGVVRASVGRHGEAELLQLPDDALVRRTVAELRERVPGWQAAEVRESRVRRWGGGLPQYLVGHRERVQRIHDAVAAVPGLAVAGAHLDGVGLPACIASGRAAARRLLS